MNDRRDTPTGDAYYQRRERQERDTAERTDNETARQIHLELADRYAALARG